MKPFKVANLREITDQYEKEEISFSRMVEMLNEVAEKYYTKKKEPPKDSGKGFATYKPGEDKYLNHA